MGIKCSHYRGQLRLGKTVLYIIYAEHQTAAEVTGYNDGYIRYIDLFNGMSLVVTREVEIRYQQSACRHQANGGTSTNDDENGIAYSEPTRNSPIT